MWAGGHESQWLRTYAQLPASEPSGAVAAYLVSTANRLITRPEPHLRARNPGASPPRRITVPSSSCMAPRCASGARVISAIFCDGLRLDVLFERIARLAVLHPPLDPTA